MKVLRGYNKPLNEISKRGLYPHKIEEENNMANRVLGKDLKIRFTEEEHREIKMIAAQNGVSMQELISRVVKNNITDWQKR